MQQPGAHKYDTWDAIYQKGDDGRYTLINTPEGFETRQTSGFVQGRDQASSIAEHAAAIAAAFGSMYAGGAYLGPMLDAAAVGAGFTPAGAAAAGGGLEGAGIAAGAGSGALEGAAADAAWQSAADAALEGGGWGGYGGAGQIANEVAAIAEMGGGALEGAGADAAWEAAAEEAKGAGYDSIEQGINEAGAISDMGGADAAWDAATEAAKEGLPEYGGAEQVANEAGAIKAMGGGANDLYKDLAKSLLKNGMNLFGGGAVGGTGGASSARGGTGSGGGSAVASALRGQQPVKIVDPNYRRPTPQAVKQPFLDDDEEQDNVF
jgi:hypothetical protein